MNQQDRDHERHDAADTIKEWMRQLAEAAVDGRPIETSAGAGPGRDYAYLHYRDGEDSHSILVLRAVMVDGRPEVRVQEFHGTAEDIARLTDAATHGEATGRTH